MSGVEVKTGVLLTCDPAVKQILIQMDQESHGEHKFVLRDLDDTHMFVKDSQFARVRELLEVELEKNMYTPNPLADHEGGKAKE